MGFPWGPWWSALNGGSDLPLDLFLCIVLRIGYYMIGLWRLQHGYGPWKKETEDIDLGDE